MTKPLIRRCVVAGTAYSVCEVADPQRRPLAVALRGPDGWKVATAQRVVATGPDQRHAIALMMRSAVHLSALGGAR